MKFFQLGAMAYIAIITLIASQAMALSQDDKSMNTVSGAARFSDPDEQTPQSAVNLTGGQAQPGNVDPSSVRYDYDPTSGSFIPHNQ